VSTLILIVVDNLSDDHYFRVRAKVNDEWYPSTWSNIVQLQIITGIDELHDNSSVVFPNPFSDQIIITPNKVLQNASIRIYDCLGNLYHSLDTGQNSKNIVIQTLNWNPGIYFVRIANSDSRQHFKIIKN